MKICLNIGEMAEWFNASDLKSGKFHISWVQIPFSPFSNKVFKIS